MANLTHTPHTTPDDRPGITYDQAMDLLKELGINRSRRTLYRWVRTGVLTVKKITGTTVFLFKDEILALAAPEEPVEARLAAVRAAKGRLKRDW